LKKWVFCNKNWLPRTFGVSIVPLLLAVVAGQEEEQRATHESRLHFPPAVAHLLNEAMQEKRMSQSVLFLDTATLPAAQPAAATATADGGP
jgi:hypothetical protein